jgi:RNA 2',3'-cyclic 3'-phosphodiesterase
VTAGASDVRAFVALEIDAGVREAIGRLVAELRPRAPAARWSRPEGVHLTLRFLGSTSPDQVESLRPALAAAAEGCPASDARVGDLGVFPARGSPRVLWVGLDLAPEILALQKACERAAVSAGFPSETRPFQPHLTLARFRPRVRRPDLPPADLGVTRLDRLVLFRSDTRPGGAVHTAILRFALGGER